MGPRQKIHLTEISFFLETIIFSIWWERIHLAVIRFLEMTSFESSGNEFSAGIASYASEKGKMYSVYSLDLSNVGTNFICWGGIW